MARIDEIAPDVYRISLFVPEFHLQFNHFLVKDDEPLLFHAGLRGLFSAVQEAAARVLDPSTIRHVGFSHFESDECGALNEWLGIAPDAQAVCGLIGAMVSVNDFASRPARSLTRDETLCTGRRRFRFIPTPHVPHGWDAGLLLEETEGILFCSDLFHQWGDTEALTSDSLIARAREALLVSESGPFAGYLPYTHHTGRVLADLASYQPRVLATMHGASFSGDGAREIRDLAGVMHEVLGPQ
ncbi:MAG TPA: MBL fold metallo-hydrolase [Bryobacteraceae bacterium]|nr:MBL fold metallo-hydrolase [Bryobacteraceae bacterium]